MSSRPLPPPPPLCWLASAPLWLALIAAAAGCPASLFDDDDSADDGGTTPPDFAYLRYDFAIDVDGDEAVVDLAVKVLDAYRAELCDYPIRFAADVHRGPGIGGPYWYGIDTGLELLGAEDPGTTSCPPEYGLPYHDGPDDLIPGWSPMGFYGCDEARFDMDFLGDDPTGVGDGSASSYCLLTAPAVRDALPDAGLGEVEAIWLGRGVDGQLDGIGQYSYLPADDGSWTWYVWGLLFAAADHPGEPQPGVSGAYLAVPFWVFVPY